MRQKLEIRNLGPIKSCEIKVDDFTILTGPQASGKSTIARAIYFFRTLKNDFFEQITYRLSDDEYDDGIVKSVEKRMRSKFLQIFGSSWSMDLTMKLKYEYAPRVYVEVHLEPDRNAPYRNFVCFGLSDKIYDFIISYENHEYIWDRDESRQELRKKVEELFQDGYEAIYIPAGRSLITVLTDRLASIMDSESRTLDFCMRSYIRLTLDKRAEFSKGMKGLLEDKLQMTQDKVDLSKIELLQKIMDRVLGGTYAYQMGEERLNIAHSRYVKINFASSGQQEVVWVFNLLYYYLLERKPILFIIEEPEAHLYPDSQKDITDALGLFGHERNQVLMTTHSPYILGELNNLLFASSISDAYKGNLPINEMETLPKGKTWAGFLKDGKIQEGIVDGFIKNELIDGASDEINSEMERLMEIYFLMESKDER